MKFLKTQNRSFKLFLFKTFQNQGISPVCFPKICKKKNTQKGLQLGLSWVTRVAFIGFKAVVGCSSLRSHSSLLRGIAIDLLSVSVQQDLGIEAADAGNVAAGSSDNLGLELD